MDRRIPRVEWRACCPCRVRGTQIRFARMIRSLVLLVLVAGRGRIEAPAPPSPRPTDTAQADAMLALLGAAASGEVGDAQIDAVMSSAGTTLIVRQQNLSRRITPQQYRTVLAA